jgi:hypothetical protein
VRKHTHMRTHTRTHTHTYTHTAEGSSSKGVLVDDVFAFPDVSGNVGTDESSSVRLVFGCEEKETGEIYRYT